MWLGGPGWRRVLPVPWGFGFGAGTDFSITRRIGIRLVQVNYSLGGFGQGPGRQLRIKTGVVFKFG
jgi:hypothetical protein